MRECLAKGFVLDHECLRNPDHPFDYFDELLRRIQNIRTSEKRFYQKITDIYATSVDYDPTSEISINFFKTVQNKIHWAITQKTAAKIIHDYTPYAVSGACLYRNGLALNWIFQQIAH